MQWIYGSYRHFCKSLDYNAQFSHNPRLIESDHIFCFIDQEGDFNSWTHMLWFSFVLAWFKLYFPLFWGMVIYDNEFEIKFDPGIKLNQNTYSVHVIPTTKNYWQLWNTCNSVKNEVTWKLQKKNIGVIYMARVWTCNLLSSKVVLFQLS